MSYEVAAASVNGISVDSHFGQAKIYRIISVDEDREQWKFVNLVELDWEDLISEGGGCCGHNEKVIEYVAEKLRGCRYVLVEKIGPRPQKILKRYGLECLETGANIDEALKKLIRYNKRFSGKEEIQ